MIKFARDKNTTQSHFLVTNSFILLVIELPFYLCDTVYSLYF